MKQKIPALICLFSLLYSFTIAEPGKQSWNTAVISGTIEDGSSGDTVLITIRPFGIDYKFLDVSYFAILHGKYFRQLIKEVTHPVCVSLVFKKSAAQDWGQYLHANLYNYLVEPGDHIYLLKSAPGYIFKGTGSRKFELQYRLDSAGFSKETALHRDISPGLVDYAHDCDQITKMGLGLLSSYKNRISNKAYRLILANTLCMGAIRKKEYMLEGPDRIDSAIKYLAAYTDIFKWKERRLIANPESIYVYSVYYPDFVLLTYQEDYFRAKGKKPGLDETFLYIGKHFQGIIREKLVCALLLKNRKNTAVLGKCLDQSASFMSTPYFKSVLKRLSLSGTPGLEAIDFELCDSTGKKHGLKEFRDRVVVLDFWFTGCSNCIRLNPILQAVEPLFQKGQVAFLTISADAKKGNWLKSLRTGLYTTPMSLDLYEGRQPGTSSVFRNYNIDNYPTLVVISKYGRLMRNPVDPRVDKGEDLSNLIRAGIREIHASGN